MSRDAKADRKVLVRKCENAKKDLRNVLNAICWGLLLLLQRWREQISVNRHKGRLTCRKIKIECCNKYVCHLLKYVCNEQMDDGEAVHVSALLVLSRDARPGKGARSAWWPP